jgi:4-amino-4-deoxy-L-arabinose transferase-like glycosyltransferase
MINRHPDLVHPPVYPALLAVVFRALQGYFTSDSGSTIYLPEQRVIMPLGHLCTLLSGVLVFLLARRLFDQRVALLGVTLFFLSDAVWDMSISGLSIPLATVLVLLSCLLALAATRHREENARALRWIIPLVFSAVFCGLAFLTRYGLIVFAPALALFIRWSFPARGSRWASVYLLIVLLVAAPWLVRNWQVSGGLLGLAPYTALNGVDPVLENEFERTLAPELKVDTTVRTLQLKFFTGLDRLYRGSLRGLGDGILSALFLTTFLYRFARDPVHRLRWCLAVAFAGLWFLGALFGLGTERLLHVIWPFALLYGLAFFFILMERLQLVQPFLRATVVGALIFLTALPLIFRLLPPRAGTPYPPYFAPYITHVCRMLKPDELLCTDMPWATAWYGDRSSLLLPLTINDFYTVNDYTKRVSSIYFTTLTRDRSYVRTLLTGSLRTWFPILEGRIPNDFPLTQGFPLNNLDQLFLTDRPRWEEQTKP